MGASHLSVPLLHAEWGCRNRFSHAMGSVLLVPKLYTPTVTDPRKLNTLKMAAGSSGVLNSPYCSQTYPVPETYPL